MNIQSTISSDLNPNRLLGEPYQYNGASNPASRPQRSQPQAPASVNQAVDKQDQPSETTETASSERNPSAASNTTGENQLTPEEVQLVQELKQIDTRVRGHERAHIAAGGSYITSSASFSYQKGPDGQNYAVGGEVSIDVSAVPGNPAATIQKMNQVRRAALAPSDPSPQDRRVASSASSQAAQAMGELTQLVAEEQAQARESQVNTSTQQQAADSYAKVSTLPESDTSSFRTAV